MKALIIHLSDIHYKNGKNAASEKMRKVASAIQNIDPDVCAIVIAVSGDIAFSGLNEEYAIAKTDLGQLKDQICSIFRDVPVHFLAVPGNHDCDFSISAGQTRNLLLQGLGKKALVTPDETTTAICCAVHDQFFSFLDDLQTSPRKREKHRLYYEYDVQVGNGNVVFRCLNTAFSSTRPENPGQMLYPTGLLRSPQSDGTTLYTVAVFHHPYNWLTPETKRIFSEHIEQTADLILTGHEHATAYYKKEAYSGLCSDYIEGAAFQPHDSSETGFNVLLIDLSIAQERVFEFRWSQDHFSSRDASGGWRPYRRSKVFRDFELTEEMLKRLEDPGATFSHPGKPQLFLEDIFVPPNVEELTIQESKNIAKAGTIDSKDLLTAIGERRQVLIVGRERSGKSTLAKVIFRHFFNHGLVPVLVEGDHIKSDFVSGKDLSKFVALVQRRVREDYKNPLLDKFDQIERDRIVLIIDDFDHARLNGRGRLRLLEMIQKRFSRIVVLGDEMLRFEELAYGDLGAKVLSDYTQLEIKEYGHVLRSAIIDKWYDVNREYATNPDLLDKKVAQAERLVDDIIRRSYLPSYPIFVLTILQGIDLSQPIDSSAGSYGYLYQVLITDRLARTASEISLDKKLGYLVELAYFMFQRRQRELSEADFQLFHSRYSEEYPAIEREKIYKALEEAGVIATYDRHYRFKYSYYFYYFVAQYFARNLEDPEVRKSVVALCKDLQKEEHANIWLLLTHQSRSDFLLDTIVAHATTIFSEIATPKFSKDVEFLQTLYQKVPALVLVNKTPEELRKERREQLDAVGDSEEDPEDPDDKENNEFLQLVSRLRAALRTLEVMGQIVKNFAGSMKNNPRFTLVKQCYELGLRVVGVILDHWQKHGDAFVREMLDVVLQKETKIANRQELERIVKSCIFFFCEMVATGMVHRISQAVGTKDLSETYRRVLEDNPTNAYKLIDVAIKLDDVGFPTGDVYALNEELQDNVFCQRLLGRLVIDHFYLFSTSVKTKQQICDRLGIEMQQLRGIDVRSDSMKRLPSSTK